MEDYEKKVSEKRYIEQDEEKMRRIYIKEKKWVKKTQQYNGKRTRDTEVRQDKKLCEEIVEKKS